MTLLQRCAVVAAAVSALSWGCVAALAQANALASVGATGTGANRDSYYSVISQDGRFVVFQSEATNLTANDTTSFYDIFWKDMQTGRIELVSVTTSGNSSGRNALQSAMSADGRFVAFETDASNIVAGDTNGTWDIFVRDMQAGTTQRVSVSSSGAQGGGRSDSPFVTSDGRYVFFHSYTAFVPEDTNPGYDVYRHDMISGQTLLVSTGAGGLIGNGDSIWPWASDDGNRVVFVSWSTNWITGDTNGQGDAFLKDLSTGAIQRINVSSAGAQNNGETVWPSISGNGKYATFVSWGSTLVSGDTNGNWDVFVRDLTNNTTTRINVRPDGAQANSYAYSPVPLSRDGRYVAFASLATDLVAGDTNGFQDIFVRDLLTNTTRRATFGYTGVQVNDDCFVPWFSGDGRYLTYTCEGPNPVPSDANGRRDIFTVDLEAALHLEVTSLTRGDQATLTASAGAPGEDVYFLATLAGAGIGPSVPQLGGLTLDVLNPIERLGSSTANSAGQARLDFRVPAGAPLERVFFQAVIRRGPGGAESVKSMTTSGVVGP